SVSPSRTRRVVADLTGCRGALSTSTPALAIAPVAATLAPLTSSNWGVPAAGTVSSATYSKHRYLIANLHSVTAGISRAPFSRTGVARIDNERRHPPATPAARRALIGGRPPRVAGRREDGLAIRLPRTVRPSAGLPPHIGGNRSRQFTFTEG